MPSKWLFKVILTCLKFSGMFSLWLTRLTKYIYPPLFVVWSSKTSRKSEILILRYSQIKDNIFCFLLFCNPSIDPFPNTSAPARLRLPVPHVSTKPLKSSLSLHAKILFYIWNEQIKYCKRYHYEVNRYLLHVNC